MKYIIRNCITAILGLLILTSSIFFADFCTTHNSTPFITRFEQPDNTPQSLIFMIIICTVLHLLGSTLNQKDIKKYRTITLHTPASNWWDFYLMNTNLKKLINTQKLFSFK